MKIHGMTVSVGYADLLGKGLDSWLNGLDTLTVVTDHEDIKTIDMARRAGCRVFMTDTFYDDGAVFNKGKAASQAVEMALPWMDWVLTFDADIIPPDDWRQVIEARREEIHPGYLYGATRILDTGTAYRDNELAGFFQLWHTSDPNVQRRPLYETCWRHAGGYDSEFQGRWLSAMEDRRILLPLEMEHQGYAGANWWGRGNHQDLRRMQHLRQVHRAQATTFELIPGQGTRLVEQGYIIKEASE